MAHMSTNAESHRRNYGENSQLTYLILDSGASYHITPEISNFIPDSSVETNKYIEVSEGNSSQQNRQRKLK